MGLFSNKIPRDELRAGDHIYTWRRGYSYSHHGIYMGDGNVIHLTRAPGFILFSSSTSQASNDGVVCCSIDDFLCGGQLYRFEYGVSPFVLLIKRAGTCSLACSNPPEQVLARASYLLNHGFGNYHLLGKNCEDFALYCKTGILKGDGYAISRSGQIKSLVAAIFAVTTISHRLLLNSSLSGLSVLVVFGLYCFFRLSYEVNFQRQNGVAVEKLRHMDNVQEKIMMEKTNSGSRWYLSLKQYLGYTIAAISIWYWIPDISILKPVLYYALLDFFVYDHLALHGLEDFSFYTIWLLGYWYWSSESTVLLMSRFLCLLSFSLIFLEDHPRLSSFVEKCMGHTLWLFGLWYWTPASIIVRLIKLVLVFFYFSNLFDHLRNHPWIRI